MIGKISLAFNVVLAIAVSWLFTRIPGKSASGGDEVRPAVFRNDSTGQSAGATVAWISGDTIMARYQFILDKSDELIKKSQQSSRKLETEMTKAEKEYAELMEYAQSGQMTKQEEQIIQQRIMELQYNIGALEEQETRILAKNEYEINKELFSRLHDFLQDFSRERGIDVVFNYQPGGQILYSGDAIDITEEVLAGLNAEYEAEKGNAKPKK
jgi:outer membrane protein